MSQPCVPAGDFAGIAHGAVGSRGGRGVAVSGDMSSPHHPGEITGLGDWYGG